MEEIQFRNYSISQSNPLMTHPYHIKITGDKLDAGSDFVGGGSRYNPAHITSSSSIAGKTLTLVTYTRYTA
jgi:hypothetical protein